MLKGYRRRFVVSTMIPVGAVLLIALAALGIFMHRSAREELRNTMSLMVRPWDAPTEKFHTLGDLPPHTEHGFDGRRPEPDGRREAPDSVDGLITTVFYDAQSGEISIMSETPADSERIAAAVEEIVGLEGDYGTLSSRGLIYYKEGIGGNCKIALAESSYISSRLLKNILLLLLIFVLAMGFFLLISIWLSRLAAKPMEEAVEMERQFVADISHDLKTPITVVLANNSILRADPGATVSEQGQWIESTDAAAKNMLKMVNEMLALSSLETVGKKEELMPVDLSSAAEKCVLQLESLAYDRGVELESDVAEGITVRATPEYIERICTGLLENALKYEPDGGRVRVELKSAKQKRRAVLTVQNFGSVIPEEDLPHIFERFYRGDKTRDIKKGHGLGLPIIKRVTELIGAQIEARSGQQEGVVFTVTFETAEQTA